MTALTRLAAVDKLTQLWIEFPQTLFILYTPANGFDAAIKVGRVLGHSVVAQLKTSRFHLGYCLLKASRQIVLAELIE